MEPPVVPSAMETGESRGFHALNHLLDLRPTTSERRRSCRGCALWTLLAPALVLVLVLSVPLTALGLLLWLPLQRLRSPFRCRHMETVPAMEPWDLRRPRTFTFVTANSCLLPSGLAKFSNLGRTPQRAEDIARALVPMGAMETMGTMGMETKGEGTSLVRPWHRGDNGYGGTMSNECGVGVVEVPVMEARMMEAPMMKTPMMVTPHLDPLMMETPMTETPIIKTPMMETQMMEPMMMEMPDPDPPIPETPEPKPPMMKTPMMENPMMQPMMMETPMMKTPMMKTPKMKTPMLETSMMEMPDLDPPMMQTPDPDPVMMEMPEPKPPMMETPMTKTPMMEPPLMETPAPDPLTPPPPPSPPLSTRLPPDTSILCLQEVFDSSAAARLSRHLLQTFPYILWDVGRVGLYNRRLRLFPSGLLVASRYPVTAAAFHSFSNGAREDALADKGVLLVQVQVGSVGHRRIVGYVGCTHLQAPAMDGSIRAAQLSMTLQWMSRFQLRHQRRQDHVAFDVICGDLNFDNCSQADSQNQQHHIFNVYRDPCRVGPGEDQPWAIGTLLNPIELHEDPVSTPQKMKRTLSSPIGRRRFLAGPILTNGAADSSFPFPFRGRRLDYTLYRPWMPTEVVGVSFITALAPSSDHLPVSLSLRVEPRETQTPEPAPEQPEQHQNTRTDTGTGTGTTGMEPEQWEWDWDQHREWQQDTGTDTRTQGLTPEPAPEQWEQHWDTRIDTGINTGTDTRTPGMTPEPAPGQPEQHWDTGIDTGINNGTDTRTPGMTPEPAPEQREWNQNTGNGNGTLGMTMGSTMGLTPEHWDRHKD
uniref:sphingomyelin phosphodiesterase n=1 Tax=Melopsittacus undulatus TaxID=13146 RepID=A0A8V5GNV7_MELUD